MFQEFLTPVLFLSPSFVDDSLVRAGVRFLPFKHWPLSCGFVDNLFKAGCPQAPRATMLGNLFMISR